MNDWDHNLDVRWNPFVLSNKYTNVTNNWKQCEELLIDINKILNIFRVLSSSSTILLVKLSFTNGAIRLAEISYDIICW